jgi:hypothetical protein
MQKYFKTAAITYFITYFIFTFVRVMKQLKVIFAIALALIVALPSALACTSAVVSGRLTRDGRPLLWKHRDTSSLDNFIGRVEATDSTEAYVALFNAQDTLMEQAWIGMNRSGFAVMNTASYNLAADTARVRDREGYVMSRALAVCHTVAEFATLLDTLAKPLGVQANFGVIDAYGGGGYFETYDHGYKFFPVGDSILIRTNFSVSGGKGGLGHVRYVNAEHLLSHNVEAGDISPELLTETLSRSFYYSPTGRDMVQQLAEPVVDRDFIPRHSTSASIVIEGVTTPAQADDMVMWTLMGYPPCGVTLPVTIDAIPAQLTADRATGHCSACDEAMRLKNSVFTRKKNNWFIDMKLLAPIIERQRAASLDNYNNFRQHNR